MTPPSESVLDSEVIQSLRELDSDPKFFSDLIRLFLNQFREKTKTIEAGMKEKNFKIIASLLHQMKSSSGNVGAMSLYELCQELESKAKSETLTEADVTEMKSLFEKASEALTAELAKG